MKYRNIAVAGLLFLAAACSAQPNTPTAGPDAVSTAAVGSASGTDLARTDTQGAVEFVVTPINLSAPGATLDFDVSMDTHSEELAWDLAAQSELTTNTGVTVRGQSWPVGNGHHYEGTLSFPATTADGQAVLDGAATLTLVIRDTDVAERVFTWELGQ
jgi:hypothetical protein